MARTHHPETTPHLLRTPETFPWPTPAPDAVTGSAAGLTLAMAYPGLTLPQRAVAIYVGDGALTGTGDSIRRLATTLGVPTDDLLDLLWDLLAAGFLGRVAGWWA